MTVSKLVYIEFTVDIEQPVKCTKVAHSYGSRSSQNYISNLIQTCDSQRAVLYLRHVFPFQAIQASGPPRGLEDPWQRISASTLHTK